MEARAGAQAAQCVVCSAPLETAARRTCCDSPDCRRRSLGVLAAQRAAALLTAATHIRDREHPGAGDEVVVGVVPSTDATPEVTPPARLSAFRLHLARIVARADRRWRRGQRELDEPWRSGSQPLPAAPPGLVEGACGTCRGHCCRRGGANAFLDEPAILHHRREHPARSTREVFDAYVAYLPDRAIEGSCVYHGERGCHLPREMRAAVCNFFYCEGLVAIAAEVARTGARKALIASAQSGEIVRHRSVRLGSES